MEECIKRLGRPTRRDSTARFHRGLRAQHIGLAFFERDIDIGGIADGKHICAVADRAGKQAGDGHPRPARQLQQCQIIARGPFEQLCLIAFCALRRDDREGHRAVVIRTFNDMRVGDDFVRCDDDARSVANEFAFAVL